MNTTLQLKGENYSPSEMRILKMLPIDKEVTSDWIMKRLYRKQDERPLNALIIVRNAVRSLKKKVVLNREPYCVVEKKLKGKRALGTMLIAK